MYTPPREPNALLSRESTAITCTGWLLPRLAGCTSAVGFTSICWGLSAQPVSDSARAAPVKSVARVDFIRVVSVRAFTETGSWFDSINAV